MMVHIASLFAAVLLFGLQSSKRFPSSVHCQHRRLRHFA
jgi:hypothetical protein